MTFTFTVKMTPRLGQNILEASEELNDILDMVKRDWDIVIDPTYKLKPPGEAA